MQSAGAPDGTVVAAWTGPVAGLEAAVRPPGGRFGPARSVLPSGRDVAVFRVAALPGGGALVVWTDVADATGVYLAVAPPGEGFGAPQRLVGAAEEAPLANWAVGLGSDAAGNALIAWIDNHRVFTATRLADGQLTTPTQLADVGFPGDVDAAVGPRGDAVVAWEVSPPSFPPPAGAPIVVVASRPPGGAFSGPETLDTARGSSSPAGPAPSIAGGVDAAVDSSGAAVVLWRTHPPVVASFNDEIRAASRPPAGAFGPKQTLGTAADPYNADAGFDRGGRALVLFSSSLIVNEEPPKNYGIVAARATPGAAFGQPRTVAAGSAKSGAPALAQGQQGAALAAWLERGAVRAAVERRSGSFCSQVVSPPPADRHAFDPFNFPPPAIAAGRRGEAVAVWYRRSRIEAAIGAADRKGPILRRLSAHSGRRGRQRVARLSFRLSEASRVRIRLARKVDGSYRRVLERIDSVAAGHVKVTLARTRRRSLRSGSYQVSAQAVDCDGRRSRTRITSFPA